MNGSSLIPMRKYKEQSLLSNSREPMLLVSVGRVVHFCVRAHHWTWDCRRSEVVIQVAFAYIFNNFLSLFSFCTKIQVMLNLEILGSKLRNNDLPVLIIRWSGLSSLPGY